MNTNLIKPHHENFTEANKGNKHQFFVNFVAFCKVVLWIAILVLPAYVARAAVVFTTLHSFTGTKGESPLAALVQGSDGYFYGTTDGEGPYGAGVGGYGTVFKISTQGALTTLYSFSGGDNGAYPVSGLVQGNDGYFYGTTIAGGTNGSGNVFKISTNGALTSFYSFSPGGTNDGLGPRALVQGSDGNFYGTTSGGGMNGSGTVFKLSTNGALTSFYSFPTGSFGLIPNVLVQGSDGNFYGTTHFTAFQLTPAGALTTLAFFALDNTPFPGTSASLVQGTDGYLYGTTPNGGDGYPGDGTVFKISTNGALTTLHAFGTDTNASGLPLDGGLPSAGLVQGSDGYFYGATEYGGTNGGYGAVFKISTNGTLTSLYSFSGGNDGGNPEAGLVQGSDGSFYGTTYDGGTNGMGTVFRLTIVPEFQGATISNEMLNLTWSTEAGGTYQLQYSSELTSTNWINSAFVATGSSMTISDWAYSGQRFYRIKIIIAPEGAVDCVASGTQSNYYSFVKGLQALAATYNLGATLQSLQGGGTSLYDVMTLDPNGCVIAYCNANLQWGCFLWQTSSGRGSCNIGNPLPAGLPVIAWGVPLDCNDGPHFFQW
jgi:uncharacterized repeat protein (TIGR03803 family)